MKLPLSMQIIAAAAVYPMLLIACASRPSSPSPPVAASKAEVVLTSPNGGVTETLFDLVACFPRVIQVHGRPTRESIIGVAVSARPGIAECLVDPKNRGADKNTKVNVDTTVSELSVENRVTGDNLTPAGQSCIKSVLDGMRAFDAAERDGGTVTSHTEFNHVGTINPSVILGVSESSDIVGEIRLAEGKWCNCFEPWKTALPQMVKSQLFFAKDKVGKTTVRVEFERIRDSTLEKIQQCLAAAIQALNLPVKSEELAVPYTFLFIHSGIEREFPDALPAVNYWQLRALRNQRAATTALKLADRVNAVLAYDGLVAQYKRKPEPSLVQPLKTACNAVLAADSVWTQALELQLDLDKRILNAVNSSRASDTAGADIEMIQRQVTSSQADLETANKTKAADGASCPQDR